MTKTRNFRYPALLFALFLLPLYAQEEKNSQVSADMSAPIYQPTNKETVNFASIAILRWYEANLTTTFAVGESRLSVAFDGADIWVASLSSNSVTELRAADGKLSG